MKAWSMFCKQCGQATERGHKFCGNCGQPIPQEQFESEAVVAQGAAIGASTVDQPSQGSAPPTNFQQDIERNRRSEIAPPPAVEKRPCPRCKKLNEVDDRVCEWCGRELRWGSASASETGAAAGLSFAGYASARAPQKEEVRVPATQIQRRVVRRRRSSVPIVEILVAVLLLGGAATAIWILRASLPPANIPSGSIKVTVSPASARIARGKTLDVLATVSGSDNVEVNWSVQEGDTGGQIESRGAKATKGKVWSQAVYSAPNTPGSYHLQAASKADPQKSAVIAITVVNR